KFYEIYGIVLFNYISAWMMGYFISLVVPKEKFGLVGTGFALAWGLVFSGGSPRLQDVKYEDSYNLMRWLWDISAPRWTVEALYLKELTPRLWVEINTENLNHTYSFNDYSLCLIYIFRISLGWGILSFLALKLMNREIRINLKKWLKIS
ncbi:10050_t:CDS:2, partial [Scutellospora calospora]